MSAQLRYSLDRSLEYLGEACGLGPLALDAAHRLTLQLEPGDLWLLIEDLTPAGCPAVLVAVSAPCPWLHPELATRILQNSDFRRHPLEAPRWMWNGERLWTSRRLDEAALDARTLEQTIHMLTGELDAIAPPA